MRVVGIGEMRGEIVAAVSWLMLSMWKVEAWKWKVGGAVELAVEREKGKRRDVKMAGTSTPSAARHPAARPPGDHARRPASGTKTGTITDNKQQRPQP
jgi:hypothetical protein